MTTHQRSAPLDTLCAELEAFASDRTSHGKHERANGARTAIAALRDGALYVDFERVRYAVADAPGARVSVFEGSRSAVLAELDDAGRGWLHEGREDLARAAARGAHAVAQGAHSVSVGSIVYTVG